MEEDDVVVLPRRRTLARLSDELDDDPVLKVSQTEPSTEL